MTGQFLVTATYLKLLIEAQPLAPRTICGNCWRPIVYSGSRRDRVSDWAHFTGAQLGTCDGQDWGAVTGATVKLAEPAPERTPR